MALSENDIVLIEKHCEGLLTEEEEVILNEKEKLFPDFAKEMVLQKTMIAAIRLKDKKLLKEELKKEAGKIILPATGKNSPIWYYAVAASILVLIVSVFALLPSKNSLFNTYYTPFPENPITRSETGSMGDYELAMQQYSIGNYKQALATFLLINNNENQDEIALYIGNCYLSMGQPKMAIGYLQVAVNSSNKAIVVQSKWYLALAYIDVGSKPQAKEQLTVIATGESPYKGKAEILLQKLRWVIY